MALEFLGKCPFSISVWLIRIEYIRFFDGTNSANTPLSRRSPENLQYTSSKCNDNNNTQPKSNWTLGINENNEQSSVIAMAKDLRKSQSNFYACIDCKP